MTTYKNWASPTVRFLIIVVAAVAIAATWYIENLDFLAVISLLSFACFISTKPAIAFCQGMIFGAIGLGLAFHWAPYSLAYILDSDSPYDVAPWIIFGGLVLWESLLFAWLGFLISKSVHGNLHPIQAAFAWVLAETFFPRVFSWGLSHCIIGYTTLLQVADLFGAAGIAFLMVYVGILFARIFVVGAKMKIEGRVANWIAAIRLPDLMCLTSLMVLWFGYGYWQARYYSIAVQTAEHKIQVAVVQVDPSFSDSLEKMRARTLQIQEHCDLVFWPESALGTYRETVSNIHPSSLRFEDVRPPIVQQQNALGLKTPLIVGGRVFSDTASEDGPYRQAAFLIQRDGQISSRYEKRFLIPFGEYCPGESVWPDLHHHMGLGDWYESGVKANTLNISPHIKAGVLVCYEDLVPTAAHTLCQNGADFLVGIINASAFESPTALRQHLRLARLRAIENRRYFVRCAGTGVSCVIDPCGNTTRELPILFEGEFVESIIPLKIKTTYQKIGIWLPYLSIAPLVISCWWSRTLSPHRLVKSAC